MSAYQVATLVLLAVTGVVTGSLCALIAERMGWARAPWFAAGVAGAVASVPAGPLAPAVAAAPVLLAVAVWLVRRDGGGWTTRLSSIWWFKVGALLIAGLLAYAPISTGMASAARSSTAQPVIVSKQSIEWSAGWHGSATLTGVSVRYSFTAGGRHYDGEARRQWSLDDVTRAKVCYDPGDPAGSHSLEQAGYSCGSFDLHTSDR